MHPALRVPSPFAIVRVMFSYVSQRLLARFSRVTSPGRKYLPQLDGLRFVAITWVFAFHVALFVVTSAGLSWEDCRSNPLIFPMATGHVGVDLFFLISGFILALPFARQYRAAGKPVRLKAYFIRRLTRLEPPYIVHLLTTFSVWLLLRSYLYSIPAAAGPDYADHVPSHLLASLVYSHQFIYRMLPFPNLVLWSLEIEVQFYILAPVLAMVFAIASPAVRRTIIVAGMLIFSAIAYYGRDVFLVSHSLLGWLQAFLAGFLLVDLYVTSWRDEPVGRYGWDLLSMAGWSGIVASSLMGPSRTLVLPWLILLSCVGAFRGRILPRVFSSAWIATIGGMCYTIYMYHGWFILAAGKATLRFQTGVLWLDVLIQLAILSVFTLAISSGLFLLFERPFMQPDWHKRLWAKVMPAREKVVPTRELAEVQAP